MKKILLLLLSVFILSCTDGVEVAPILPTIDKEEKKIVTIASKRLGIIDDSELRVSETCVARSDDNPQWQPFDVGRVAGFEYKEGSEYTIRYKEQHSSYNGADPFIYQELLEVISCEERNSDGLPESFLPTAISDGENENYYIFPAKISTNATYPKYFVHGDAVNFNKEQAIYFYKKPNVIGYFPYSITVITDLGTEREVKLWNRIEAHIDEIFTQEDRSRLLAMPMGASIEFKVKVYNWNESYETEKRLTQESTMIFTHEKN